MAEFSDFTKLVLDRMDTNPEEFAAIGGNYTRWQGLVNGLEELARGDTEGRFIKVLWPLSEHERAVLLEKYRKIYLAELHKDMLKNIVSGNDKEEPRTYQYADSNVRPLGVSTGTLRGGSATLAALDDSFARVSVKAEGTAINPVRPKFILTPTQVEIAKRNGITPYEYARRLAQHEASDND